MEAARQNRALKQKRMRNRSEILKALSCRNRVRRFKFSRFTPARFGRFGADFLKFNSRGLGALKFHRFEPSRRFRHLGSGRLKLHAPRLGRLKFHLGLGGVKINPFGFSRAKFDAPRLGRAKFDRFRTLGAKILNFIRFEIFSANFTAAGGFKICGVKFCRPVCTDGFSTDGFDVSRFSADGRYDFARADKVGTESSRGFARASGFDAKRPRGAVHINGSDTRRFYGSVYAGFKILRSHGSANADRSEILRSRGFARASGSEILRPAPFLPWRRARVDLPARRLLARLRFSFGLPVCRQARVHALSRLGRKR